MMINKLFVRAPEDTAETRNTWHSLAVAEAALVSTDYNISNIKMRDIQPGDVFVYLLDRTTAAELVVGVHFTSPPPSPSIENQTSVVVHTLRLTNKNHIEIYKVSHSLRGDGDALSSDWYVLKCDNCYTSKRSPR